MARIHAVASARTTAIGSLAPISHEPPAGAGELERDGRCGPGERHVTGRLRDDVPVVVAGLERQPGGPGKVQAVHPQVAVVDDV